MKVLISVEKKNIDFILAIGGGSVIDSAKAIGIGVPYDGDFFDFFEKKQVPQKSIKVGVILTLPGSGSESSDGAVITHEQLKRNMIVVVQLCTLYFLCSILRILLLFLNLIPLMEL